MRQPCERSSRCSLLRRAAAATAATVFGRSGWRATRRSTLPARGGLGAASERQGPFRVEGLRVRSNERVVHDEARHLRADPRTDAAQRPAVAERRDPERPDRTDRELLHRAHLWRYRAVPRVHARQRIELGRVLAGSLRNPDLRQLGFDRRDEDVGRRCDLPPVDRQPRRRRIAATRQCVTAPGEWQSFQAWFRAPRFDAAGKKIEPARFIRVLFNGLPVQKDVDIDGPTRANLPIPEAPQNPLMIQGDHGPVALRNIYVRPLRPLILR